MSIAIKGLFSLLTNPVVYTVVLITEYQDSLVENKKHSFEIKEIPIEDIFRRLIDHKVIFRNFFY